MDAKLPFTVALAENYKEDPDEIVVSVYLPHNLPKIEFHFTDEGCARGWLKHVSELPGCKFNKEKYTIDCDGTLTVEEWRKHATDVEFAENCTVLLISEKEWLCFFFTTHAATQNFIESNLKLHSRPTEVPTH